MSSTRLPMAAMLMIKNDSLLRALWWEPVDRTPVWLMRQAGRYLPEYRRLREKQPNFLTFCKTPELVCEATLQPLVRFPLDAAIIFSDIFVIPDAMGVELEISPSIGPVIANPIRSSAAVKRLRLPPVEEALGYVREAIRLVVKELGGRVPLIGFAGSPWTLVCYLIEGRSSKSFSMPRAMCYQDPHLLHQLLQKITRMTVDYLNAQIEAGVDVLMLFDTWGGILSLREYRLFSLYYLSQIAKKVRRERDGKKIPLIFYAKGVGQWLEWVAASGCDAIGIDWTIDMGEARALVGDRVALQGNLDPAILLTSPKVVSTAVTDILRAYGGGAGHVFNLGHGIDPHTPLENVSALIEAVYSFQMSHGD